MDITAQNSIRHRFKTGHRSMHQRRQLFVVIEATVWLLTKSMMIRNHADNVSWVSLVYRWMHPLYPSYFL